MVTYEVLSDSVLAHDADGEVVGASSLAEDGTMTVVVSAGHRGRGVGGELLVATAGVALARGRQDVVLVAPSEDETTMRMLASRGLRGLARLDAGVLRVRVSLAQIRPERPGHQEVTAS